MDHGEKLGLGEEFGVDLFVVFEGLRAWGEAGGEEGEHFFGEDAGGGVEPAEGVDGAGGVAGFFGEFAGGGCGGVFGGVAGCSVVGGVFEGAGGEFEEGVADGVAAVADEDEAAVVEDGEDNHGTGVEADFSDAGFAGVGGDGAEDEVEAFAFIDELVGGEAAEGGHGVSLRKGRCIWGDNRGGKGEERGKRVAGLQNCESHPRGRPIASRLDLSLLTFTEDFHAGSCNEGF